MENLLEKGIIFKSDTVSMSSPAVRKHLVA